MTTTRVHRIDLGTLKSPEYRADGSVIVQARLTRTGVFPYADPTMPGGVRKEYRPPSTVFNADSMASLALVPVTNDHPPEMLSAQNVRKYQVGTVGQDLHRDGDHIAASLVVNDPATIAAMKAGKSQVSCGYDVDLDMTPGTTPEGEKYDCVQVPGSVRGNHLAIVHNARAGREASIRMDAAFSDSTDDETLSNPHTEVPVSKRSTATEYDKMIEHNRNSWRTAGDKIEPVAQRVDTIADTRSDTAAGAYVDMLVSNRTAHLAGDAKAAAESKIRADHASSTRVDRGHHNDEIRADVDHIDEEYPTLHVTRSDSYVSAHAAMVVANRFAWITDPAERARAIERRDFERGRYDRAQAFKKSRGW